MESQAKTELVDDTIDAYVDWREECAHVWNAYERWSGASVADRPSAFSAYRAALDREELASRVYAGRISRLAAAEQRPSGMAAAALRVLRMGSGSALPSNGIAGPGIQ
jgi:hypothetical protein